MKLLKKLWVKVLLTSIFLINFSSIITELFSEFLFENQKLLIFYEAWNGIFYETLKTLQMVEADAYMHMKDSELKKTNKIKS